MDTLHIMSLEKLINGHQKRVEQLRLDWVEARNKNLKGKMKFIEKLGKIHNKEIEELQRKIK